MPMMLMDKINQMTDTNLLTITTASAAVLLLLCVLLIFLRISAYKKRTRQAKSILASFPNLSKKNKEQMEQLPIAQEVVPEFSKNGWGYQKTLYQTICKAATSPSLKGLTDFPKALEKLVTLYQTTLIALETLAKEGKRVQEVEKELEKTKTSIDAINAEKDEVSHELMQLTDTYNDRMEFEKKIVEDIALLLSEKPRLELSTSLERFDEHYQYLYTLLEEKLLTFDYDKDDDFNQSKALIEQLRFEKIQMTTEKDEALVMLNRLYYKYILKQRSLEDIEILSIKEMEDGINKSGVIL